MPRYKSMRRYIDSQVKFWEQSREKTSEQKDKPLPFVTISREYGCGGYETGSKLAEKFNSGNPGLLWAAYDNQLIDRIMDDMGLSSTLAETLTSSARKAITNLIQTSFSKFPPQVAVYRKLAEIIRILADNGHVIIIGRSANLITQNLKGGYHIRLVASMDWKTERISSIFGITKNEARKKIDEKTKERESFIREFIKYDITDPHNYDLVINNSAHTSDEVTDIIIESMRIKKLL